MQQFVYVDMYKNEEKHWWFRAKRKIVNELVKKHLASVNPNILDAGCGCGLMLNEMKKFGTVYGMDFSESAISFSKSVFDGELRQGSLTNDIPYQDRKFDMILCLDVLEHIDDDVLALYSIKDLLKNNGKAILTVPAFMSLWSYHDEIHMHKRRYSYNELKEKITGVGFQVDMISYYNFFLLPGVWFVRQIKRILGIKDENLDTRVPNKLINGLLEQIFSFESFFLSNGIRLPFGVSLIAVIRKK